MRTIEFAVGVLILISFSNTYADDSTNVEVGERIDSGQIDSETGLKVTS